jgi:SAM-dependent methyltransferase
MYPLDFVDRFDKPSVNAFDEARYLSTHKDVADAIRAGHLESGRQHYVLCGQLEGRGYSHPSFNAKVEEMRRRKRDRILPLLSLDLAHRIIGDKFDFLTSELKEQTGITDTGNVSSNAYDQDVRNLVAENAAGLILDCGAGRRDTYYSNVVNYEIVNYDTTDVIGVGEALPFNDGAFEAVISVAVLEHVKDPFKCASEIARVLKPGGRLIAAVPFLQPLHGYPHHYYNMSHQGLRALFDRYLIIEDQKVCALPVSSLTWYVQAWARGLEGNAREAFLNLTLRDLMVPAITLHGLPWVTELSNEKNLELACATVLFAHRPR